MKRNTKLLSASIGLIATIGMVAFQAQPIIKAQAALATPSGVDWSYKAYELFGDYIWQTKEHNTNTYYDGPMYTRYTNGTFYDYATTLDDTLGLPIGISIELRFNKATTSWNDLDGAFYPNQAYIGSNANDTTITKFQIIIYNASNHDYRVYFDSSSTNANYNLSIDDNKQNVWRSQWWTYNQVSFNYNPLYVKAYDDLRIFSDSTANGRYFDAIYLDDLGVSSAYSNGYTNGDNDGYQSGYDDGMIDGYDNGVVDGYNDGYDVGYLDGNDEGQAVTGLFAILTGAVSAISGIFNLELFPGLSIGGLLMIPLLISVFMFFKKMSRSN